MKLSAVAVILAVSLYGQTFAWAQTADVEPVFREGTAALQAGRLEQAADAFTQVAQMSPRFAEAYFNLGLAREQQGKHEEAAAALQKAIALRPALRGANLFLGIADYRLNRLDDAERALRRETRLNPNDAKAWMWLGVDMLAMKRVDDAAEALNTAAKLDPHDADILYHRGRALLLQSRDSYQRMFALDPDSWRVHQVLAQGDAESERDADAVNEYQIAIQKAPNQPGLRQSLATELWKMGKLTEAEEQYKAELQIDPNDTLAAYQLGCLLVESARAKQGRPMIEEALTRDPNLPIASFYLGRADLQLGNDALAIEEFRQMLAQSPDIETEQQTYYQLSRLYRRQHAPDLADDAIRHFKEIQDTLREQTSASLAKRRRNQGDDSSPPLPVPEADSDSSH